MGTNYYVVNINCDLPGKALHIGKSNCGWVFLLRIYPDKNINNLKDWIPFFQKGEIYNSCGFIISFEDMLNIIQDRRIAVRPFKPPVGSLLGPNNLLRNQIDNRFCVGHGEGTWDYIIKDFS